MKKSPVSRHDGARMARELVCVIGFGCHILAACPAVAQAGVAVIAQQQTHRPPSPPWFHSDVSPTSRETRRLRRGDLCVWRS